MSESNQQVTRSGWLKDVLALACVLTVFFSVEALVQHHFRVGWHMAFFYAGLCAASVAAFLGSSFAVQGAGPVAITSTVLSVSHWKEALDRGEAGSGTPWLMVLILVPLTLYFAGRLIRKRRTFPSNN